VKIIIAELKAVKRQGEICNYDIGVVGKHVHNAANVAVTECKKLSVEMADQKVELVKRIDHQIK